jgi:hypothetical protein
MVLPYAAGTEHGLPGFATKDGCNPGINPGADVAYKMGAVSPAQHPFS